MLLREVETFLKATGMPPTRLGRDAVRDPQFVFDLRRGRQPGDRVRNRVRAFMEQRS